MSHYIAELIIPPTTDIEKAVREVMFLGNTEPEEGEEHPEHPDWWDWYVIGGRFSGEKTRCAIDPSALERFHAALIEKGVTVSGVTCGKQEISPASQIPVVDSLWQEHCPGSGERCLLFNHGRDQYSRSGLYPDDICTVDKIPERLACTRILIAKPHYQDPARLGVGEMLATDLWNGVSWQDTKFDGKVKANIAEAMGGRNRCKISADWLCVTVDYHN